MTIEQIIFITLIAAGEAILLCKDAQLERIGNLFRALVSSGKIAKKYA
ncbi:MAG: hypothetical protein IJ452_02440 [Butyricicoccus sp.]|nr:hypothetical protein [Butyricicoccus sp.]MBQ8585125.1 hypothetical protein [Butyricicoccus sp.]